MIADKILTVDSARALIFDCDGTLVDSMPLHMRAWRYAFDQIKAVHDEEFLLSAKGMKETEIIELYNRYHRTSLDPLKTVRIKHDYFYQHIQNVRTIPVVADIAKQYYGRLPLAVVSGSLEKIVHEELKITGLFGIFDLILTADDPFKPKPAPDIFREAAKRLGVTPEFCLVFEDGDAGLEAAVKAGMRTVDIRLYI